MTLHWQYKQFVEILLKRMQAIFLLSYLILVFYSLSDSCRGTPSENLWKCLYLPKGDIPVCLALKNTFFFIKIKPCFDCSCNADVD